MPKELFRKILRLVDDPRPRPVLAYAEEIDGEEKATREVCLDGEKITEWPSKRGPITKIMPSDGCKRDTVPLVVGRWYNFYEFGCHLGNVG